MIASATATSVKDSPYYKWIILFNVMIATFMAVLDATVVNTALPVIMGTLGAPMNTVEWILTVYMLSLATTLAITGWLSDKFGYKEVFIDGLAVFTVGSLMCGNSSTIGELIFWRIIEGDRKSVVLGKRVLLWVAVGCRTFINNTVHKCVRTLV